MSERVPLAKRVEDIDGPNVPKHLIEHLCIDGTVKQGRREHCCLAEWKAAGA